MKKLVMEDGSIEMKSCERSPFVRPDTTEVTLITTREEIEVEGEKLDIPYHFYRCEETGEEFTTTPIDEINQSTAYLFYNERMDSR